MGWGSLWGRFSGARGGEGSDGVVEGGGGLGDVCIWTFRARFRGKRREGSSRGGIELIDIGMYRYGCVD